MLLISLEYKLILLLFFFLFYLTRSRSACFHFSGLSSDLHNFDLMCLCVHMNGRVCRSSFASLQRSRLSRTLKIDARKKNHKKETIKREKRAHDTHGTHRKQ